MHGAFLAIMSVLFVGLWSSGWIVSGLAVDQINVVSLLTIRYLLVMAILWVLVVVTGSLRKIKRMNVRAHLLVGLLSHAAYLLAGVGAFELGVSAALVAFVTALQPMLTAVMSRFITREPVFCRQWQGLIIGLCAVLLLISESYRQGVTGYALTLPFIAVLSLSLGTLITRRIELDNISFRRKPDPIIPVLFLQCCGALSILIPMSIVNAPETLTLHTEHWLAILWLALAVSLGAYAVLLIMLRHMSAMQVSSLSYLVPPATMLQAWFVFGDSISRLDIAALLLAAVGVFLVLKPVQIRAKIPSTGSTSRKRPRIARPVNYN